MRTVKLVLGVSLIAFSFSSCKKDKCAECHYDGPNGEVELGQKCNDEIEDLEKNGYTTGGQTYTVHCGEGH